MAASAFINTYGAYEEGQRSSEEDEVRAEKTLLPTMTALYGRKVRKSTNQWQLMPETTEALTAQWLNHDDVTSALLASKEPEILKICDTLALTGRSGNLASGPSYSLRSGELCEINQEAVYQNFRAMVFEGRGHKMGMVNEITPLVTTVPNTAELYTNVGATLGVIKRTIGPVAAITELDAITRALENELTKAVNMPMATKRLIIHVLTHVNTCEESIPKMSIRSRKEDGNYNSTGLDTIQPLYHSVLGLRTRSQCVTTHRNNRERILHYVGLAKKAFAKHHGLTGTNTAEASAISRVTTSRGDADSRSGATAPGELGKVDQILTDVQTVYWAWNVTGWVAATKWSADLCAVLDRGILDEEQGAALTEWVFSRSTYRRMIGSNAIQDATRDVSASKVTQAATTTVRWRRELNCIIHALDDLEYAVVAGSVPLQISSAYWSMLDYLLEERGTGYGNLPALPRYSMVGKKICSAPAYDEGSVNPPILYAQVGLSGGATYANLAPASRANGILHSINAADAKDGKQRIRTASETADIYTVMNGDNLLSYLVPSSIKGTGINTSYVYLAGIHFREDQLKYPVPLLEFMNEFTDYAGPEYQTGEVNDTKRKTTGVKLRLKADPAHTQQHHKNTSFIQVLAICGHAWAPCLDTIANWDDANLTFATALLIAMAALPPELFALMKHWRGWRATSMAEYRDYAKRLSVKMKALDNQVSIGDYVLDLSPLFEWEVLPHRAVEHGDMKGEILERRDKNLQVKLTAQQLKRDVTDVFKDVAAKLDARTREGSTSPLYQAWEDFVENRVNATPSGSAFTADELFIKARAKLKEIGVKDLTKTQVMAAMPDVLALDDLLKREPELLAQTSWKYEWGKTRALFAAAMEHWAVSAFAFAKIEEYMPDDCPIGKAADADRVCKRVMELTKEGVVACIDAANFNILHSHEVMAMIHDVYASVMGNRISPEQHKAIKWLRSCELNQKVIVSTSTVGDELIARGHSEGWIKTRELADSRTVEVADLHGGMFSGVRITMLVNTILNRAYYRYAARSIGIKPRALHSGDDVYAVFSSYAEAYQMKGALQAIGYTLQLAKCFVEGVKEFLRISHKNANTTQYLSRSAATAVHGRVEADNPTDFVATVNAVLRRGAELIVRHAVKAPIADLLVAQTRSVCARWGVARYAWNAFLALPKIFGGSSEVADLSGAWSGMTIARTAEARGDVVPKLADLPGVATTARKLLEELKVRKFHRRVREAIAAAIAPKGVVMNYGIALRWMTRTDVEKLRNVAGTLKHVTQGREFILSKAAGLFNTLALNEQYWGDLAPMLRGIHSNWHGQVLACALAPVSDVIDNTTTKHDLDDWISSGSHRL
ncbi:RNA-dependent RNA polymerase [Thelonectria quadrivirus 1]|nr:RNA-dependent RNA polymerase [Thelonectria quadrivirus 1]